MLFSSFEFIFLFLPVTLALYYAAPMKLRNFVLLIMSIVFYGWDVKHYILLMLATIAVDYGMAIAVSAAVKRERKRTAKGLLALTVVLNLAILGFFKYFGFAADIFSSLTGISVSVPQVTLPVGISFYTFQSLSYVIDVYRQECAAQFNPITFGTYVTMYPQLIAGPIVRYGDVEKQLQKRTHSCAVKCPPTSVPLWERCWESCSLRSRYILISRDIPIWQWVLARCLDSTFASTSITRTRQRVFRTSGGVGTFRCPPGSASTSISLWAAIAAPSRATFSTFSLFGR